MKRTKTILLNPHELQSGVNRQRRAENLIKQLPSNHDGRNTWLLNFGTGDEAQKLRANRGLLFLEKYQSAETHNAQIRRGDE